MEDSVKAEAEVVKRFKESCYPNGREINPQDSAVFIRELGLIYKTRAPNKICLIQSAALLNAARVRNNDDVINNDLREFCSDLLKCGNAENKEADLLAKSSSIGDQIKIIRENVTKQLSFLPDIEENTTDDEFNKLKKLKIKGMNKIQKMVTDSYKNLMREIAHYCTQVMGKPPCEFALVGLGSISRNEITPYSDFENVIILEDNIIETPNYEDILEYFRWWSVIFQVLLINLGETLIPCVAIPTLNDPKLPHYGWYYDEVTTRGISFDGMIPHACKFPLGRTEKTQNKNFTLELIKPVRKMAELVEKEQDIKNGYHLADMLTTSCFVAGNDILYSQFNKLVQEKLDYIKSSNPEEFINSIRDEVKKQTNDFSVFKNLNIISDKETFNIKSIVYRTSTIFVAALGRLHGIKCSSCIDIINGLHAKKLITDNDAIDLKFIISVACEARIKIYVKKGSQEDTIENNEENSDLIEEVGIRSLVYYFLICDNLQEKMMDMHEGLKLSWQLAPKILYHFKQYIKSVDEAEKLIQRNVEGEENCYATLAWCFTETKEYTKALKYYEMCVDMFTSKSLDASRDGRIASLYHDMGMCMRHLFRYHESIKYFELSLKIRFSNIEEYQDISSQLNDDAVFLTKNKQLNEKIAGLFTNIGASQLDLDNYTVALKLFNKALIIREQISNPNMIDRDGNVAGLVNNIGLCHSFLGNKKQCRSNFNKALDIYSRISKDQTIDMDIARVFINIGNSFQDKNELVRSKSFILKALEIYKRQAPKKKLNYDFSKLYISLANNFRLGLNYEEALLYYEMALETVLPNPIFKSNQYNNMANVLSKMNRYEQSIDIFNKALEIKRTHDKYDKQEREIADVLSNIGLCHCDFGFHYKALPFFQESVEIRTKISKDNTSDLLLASTFGNYSMCLFNTGNILDAKHYAEMGLKIRKKSSNGILDIEAADFLSDLGECYYALKDDHNALKQFKAALDLYKSESNLNAKYACKMADCLNNIGTAESALGRTQEALTCFKEAITIKELNPPLYPHPRFTVKIATIYYNTGDCYYNLKQYTSALEYLIKVLNLLSEERKLYENILFETYTSIAGCFQKLQNYQKALKNFESAQKYVNSCEIHKLATIYRGTATARMDLEDYELALKNFNSWINVAKFIQPTPSDFIWAKVYYERGFCCMNLELTKEALSHFENALLYFDKMIDDPARNNNLAASHNKCRICLTLLNKHEEALVHFNKLAEIDERMSANPKTDHSLAELYLILGDSEFQMQKYTDALKHLQKSLDILSFCANPNDAQLFLIVNPMIELCYFKTFCCFK